MRLLVKTTSYYILISFLFFLTAGYILSLNISSVMEENIKSLLVNREEIATTQILNEVSINSLNNFDQIIKRLSTRPVLDSIIFKDTTMYDVIEDEFHTYRTLQVNRKIGRNYYDIKIFTSLIESNLFVNEILKAMSIVFIGLLIFLIIGTVFVSRGIWLPFHNTLSKLKTYELGKGKTIEFHKTTTTEFDHLNSMIKTMIARIHEDYLNLKEFTENAAHEIQTPLTIIQSKCEMLLQSKNLSEKDLLYIGSIYNTSLRLSKINHGLTLLAKIEAGAYENDNGTDVTDILKVQLNQYREIILLNNLSLYEEFECQIFTNTNSELMIIVVSNLIRNAIKHNIPNGEISIKSFKSIIRFSNTGKGLGLNSDEFNRFKRSDKASLGLGLSIVKKICNAHNINLIYKYEQGYHHFDLDFKNPIDSLQN